MICSVEQTPAEEAARDNPDPEPEEGERQTDTDNNPWKAINTRRAQPNPLSQIMMEALHEQKKEEDDQEKRDRNIIIFRATEAKDTDSKKRIAHDEGFFHELCVDVLEIGEIEVVEVPRLGKPTQDMTRPLRIKLKDKADKARITSKLRNLSRAEDKFRGISVADDLTKKNRDEVRLLVQQAKNWLESNKGESWKFRGRGTKINTSTA